MSQILQRKSFSIGVLMAAVFLAIDTVIPIYVGYETLVLAFAACVLLVCSALIDTPREGLICGLTVLVAQNAGAFAKVAIRDGSAIAAAAGPYLLFLTSSYVIVGLLGGYLGEKLRDDHRETKKLPVIKR